MAQRYIGAVESLQTVWRERLREHRALRSDAVAWAIIDLLPAYPIVTATAVMAATGRDRSTVLRAFEELSAAGVLHPTTEGQRNQLFETRELLVLIEQMEAGSLTT
jgi:Fic family protein